MNDVDWDGFRYFVVAAELGSLSAAAKSLNSNQPTVGRHIDALESALGVKLFQRHVQGLTLTQEGTRIFEQSQLMQSSVVKIQRAIQGEKEEISGTVRISVPEGLCLEILLPALPEFYQQFPSINLILSVSAGTANLTRGEADVAIRLFRPTEADLVIKFLADMSMGLYASQEYCNAYGVPASLQDLREHRVIAYGDQLSGMPENQWLLDHFDSSSRILCSDSTKLRLEATLAGLGISIQPRLFSEKNNNLLPLLINTVLPGHEIWLAYHHDLRHAGRIRSVVDFVVTKLSRQAGDKQHRV